MKKLLMIIAFTSISTFAKTQNTLAILPEVDGKITYESIVDVPGKTKDFIFSAANKWILDSFKNSTGGVESEDKDQGQILGKGNFQINEITSFFVPSYNYTYNFKIQIDCKDNKYRIRLYNMTYDGTYPLEMYNQDLRKSTNKTVHQNAYLVDAQFKATMASLADSINKAANDDF